MGAFMNGSLGDETVKWRWGKERCLRRKKNLGEPVDRERRQRGSTEASLNSQNHLVRNPHRPGTLPHILSTISRQSYVSPEALFTQEVSTGFVFHPRPYSKARVSWPCLWYRPTDLVSHFHFQIVVEDKDFSVFVRYNLNQGDLHGFVAMQPCSLIVRCQWLPLCCHGDVLQ